MIIGNPRAKSLSIIQMQDTGDITCDSDDDLLEFTDSYPSMHGFGGSQIANFNRPIHNGKCNNRHFKNNLLSGSKGFSQHNISIKTTSKNFESFTGMKSNKVSNSTKVYDNFVGSESTDIKVNKYQRMREVRNITGFIVNVHDATNFDIDLDISPNLHEKYQDVISNQYTYQDLGTDFLENPDLDRITNITPQVGTTYRCRLRGVGINQLSPNIHTWKSNQMCVEVKQLIDRTDGWITCTLSDIDVYQRILVDIIIPTCQGPINLREYLLKKMVDDDNPLFYPYSGKRDRNVTKHEIQS